MSFDTLRRASGLCLVLGAVGCLVGGLLHPIVDGHAHSAEALTKPGELAGTSALLVGTILLLLGLPLVYAWLAPRLGKLGLAGFLLYFLGNLLSPLPHLVVMAFIGAEVARRTPELISPDDMIIDSPAFVTEQVVFGMVFVAGLLLLGIALFRDRRLPTWIGGLGVLGAVLALVPLPIRPVVSALQIELARGLMVAGLGVLAFRSAGEPPTLRPAPPARRRPLATVED